MNHHFDDPSQPLSDYYTDVEDPDLLTEQEKA